MALVLTTGDGASRAAESDGDIDVVLLGDSYSAGNGAGNYFPTFVECHRSYENWASRYAEKLREDGLLVSFTELNNAACSGAETTDVIEGQKFAIDNETDVVLLTIGGNDGEAFESVVLYCFFLQMLPPTVEDVVRAPNACKSSVDRAKEFAGVGGELQSSVEEVLSSIRDQGLRPDARIVLLSYPYLDVADDYFSWYPVGAEVRALGDLGDQAQAGAVAAANVAGIGLVSDHCLSSRLARICNGRTADRVRLADD